MRPRASDPAKSRKLEPYPSRSTPEGWSLERRNHQVAHSSRNNSGRRDVLSRRPNGQGKLNQGMHLTLKTETVQGSTQDVVLIFSGCSTRILEQSVAGSKSKQYLGVYKPT